MPYSRSWRCAANVRRSLGRLFEMRPRFVDPRSRLGLSDEVEEPLEERDAVALAQPEASGMGCECVSERAGVVVDAADRVSDELCDGLGVFLLPEEVGGDPRWPRHRQP